MVFFDLRRIGKGEKLGDLMFAAGEVPAIYGKPTEIP
jgi:hypothetical protein